MDPVLKALFTSFDLIELIVLAGFGTLLFVAIIIQIFRAILKSGSPYLLAGFAILVAIMIVNYSRYCQTLSWAYINNPNCFVRSMYDLRWLGVILII